MDFGIAARDFQGPVHAAFSVCAVGSKIQLIPERPGQELFFEVDDEARYYFTFDDSDDPTRPNIATLAKPPKRSWAALKSVQVRCR